MAIRIVTRRFSTVTRCRLTFRFSHETVSNDCSRDAEYNCLSPQDRLIYPQVPKDPEDAPNIPRAALINSIASSPFVNYSFSRKGTQDAEKHFLLPKTHPPPSTISSSCPSSPKTMSAHHHPHLKGREPQCGRLPPGLSAKKSSLPSPPTDFSKNSVLPTHGESTQGQRRAKSSTNVSSVPSTTKAYGQPRRSANTPKTPHGAQVQLDLREVTSPPSIPVSPNYFDLLSVEEEEAHQHRPQKHQHQEHQQEQQKDVLRRSSSSSSR